MTTVVKENIRKKEIKLPGRTESFISISITSDNSKPEPLFAFIDEELSEATLIRIWVFGPSDSYNTILKFTRGSRLDLDNDPVSFLVTPMEQKDIYVLVHTARHIRIEQEWPEHNRKARFFRAEEGDFLYLTDLDSPATEKGRTRNQKEVLDRLSGILLFYRFNFQNIYRTWYYLESIYDWYSDFNGFRTDYYASRAVTRANYPASTGIGIENRQGNPLNLSINAVRNFQGNMRQITAHGQCRATDYGSSFSRGIAMETNHYKRLFLSGTASIDEKGQSVYTSDFDKQTEKTLEVFYQLLTSEGLNWDDILYTIVYLKDFRMKDRFFRLREQLGIPGFPVVFCTSLVCREELLFEMEAEAFRTV